MFVLTSSFILCFSLVPSHGTCQSALFAKRKRLDELDMTAERLQHRIDVIEGRVPENVDADDSGEQRPLFLLTFCFSIFGLKLLYDFAIALRHMRIDDDIPAGSAPLPPPEAESMIQQIKQLFRTPSLFFFPAHDVMQVRCPGSQAGLDAMLLI